MTDLTQQLIPPSAADGAALNPWWILQQILAAAVAVLITILDNFPYGFLLFPGELPGTSGFGISMVLLSAAMAQIVFALLSDLPVGLGCMIVENTPMLHSMALSVSASVDRPEQIVPTLLALYAVASLLTSLAFFLLGYFQLERIFKILPQPVLMGCIAGMGSYILTAGLAACTGVSWEWTETQLLRQAQHWPKLLVLFCLEMMLLYCLKLSRGRGWESFVLPLFFLGLLFGSWISLACLGCSHRHAQEEGWFFRDFQEDSGMSWNFQLDLVAWRLFPYQLPLLCGIVIFSCLHVPVNVPALAQATRKQADINKELFAHGVANLFSGCCGCLQTYMVYSSSVLYHKCGGGARVTGVIVGFLVILCIPVANSLISYVPRMLAGVLLGHLGVELLWESLLDTWPNLDTLEYVIVVVIAVVCNISFIFSLLFGLLCACVAFVVQAARSDPVRFAFYPGRGVRSRQMRSQRELRILEEFDQKAGFLILRLHGVLFFGNTHSLPERVQKVKCRAVIIDFAQVISIDSSAFSELNSLAGTLQNKSITLICSGLMNMSKVQRHPHLAAARFAKDMDTAVALVESLALATSDPLPSTVSVSSLLGDSQRAEAKEADIHFFQKVCDELLQHLDLPLQTSVALRAFFEFQRVAKDTVLWRPGDPADFAFLLVTGHVGVLDDFCDSHGRHSRASFVECSVPGQFTGELNLFTGESRKNRIVATEDLSMWTITRESLQQMQRDQLQLAFAFQSIALRYAAHRMNLSMLDGHVHTV